MKTITRRNNSIKQLYMKLSDHITCYGIMNLDGQKVYTIGYYLGYKIWTNMYRKEIYGRHRVADETLDILSI